MPLELTDEAKLQAQEIYEYTENTWGIVQRKKYMDLLFSGLNQLCSKPERGRLCPNVDADLRAIRIQHHYAYYYIESKIVLVVAILHERMDPGLHTPATYLRHDLTEFALDYFHLAPYSEYSFI